MEIVATTDYFRRRVLRDRPEIRLEWCMRVIANPLREAHQSTDGRWRFWGIVPEYGGRYLRVVTLADRVTLHNAFFDRGFRL
jgi:hypothetical protein